MKQYKNISSLRTLCKVKLCRKLLKHREYHTQKLILMDHVGIWEREKRKLVVSKVSHGQPIKNFQCGNSTPFNKLLVNKVMWHSCCRFVGATSMNPLFRQISKVLCQIEIWRLWMAFVDSDVHVQETSVRSFKLGECRFILLNARSWTQLPTILR